MKCAACGAANDFGRAYCGGCAHQLGDTCPICGFLNGEGVRYCGGCACDRRAAPNAPAPLVRAAPIDPAAAAVAAAVEPAGSSRVGGNLEDLLSDLEDLGDLVLGTPDVACGEDAGTVTADVTQSDVDGFFQRLAQEGVVEIHPPAPSGQAPGTSGGAPP